VAVLGAGTMGSQIAAHFANAGLQVLLLDIAPKEGPRNALVQKQFKQATGLRPDPFFDKDAVNRVSLGNFEDDFERIAEADWVIEVVVERLDIKRQVMERVERYARPDAVISTNTSGIPVAQIADGRSGAFKSRLLGTASFHPPCDPRLLDVVRTDDTS